MISRSFINFLAIAYVLAVLVLLFCAENFLPSALGSSYDKELTLESRVNEQFKLTLDLISRRIGLASALIAATFWLISRPLTDEVEAKERLTCCGVAFVSALASLIFGYQAYENILVMIGSGKFDAFADAIDTPQTLQYYGLIIGAAFIGLGAIRSANAIYTKVDR
ncbi:MAG: hypothetical protein ABJP33_01470 [Pseudoruegeria sp.]